MAGPIPDGLRQKLFQPYSARRTIPAERGGWALAFSIAFVDCDSGISGQVDVNLVGGIGVYWGMVCAR